MYELKMPNYICQFLVFFSQILQRHMFTVQQLYWEWIFVHSTSWMLSWNIAMECTIPNIEGVCDLYLNGTICAWMDPRMLCFIPGGFHESFEDLM